jgi:hypothetical protein
MSKQLRPVPPRQFSLPPPRLVGTSVPRDDLSVSRQAPALGCAASGHDMGTTWTAAPFLLIRSSSPPPPSPLDRCSRPYFFSASPICYQACCISARAGSLVSLCRHPPWEDEAKLFDPIASPPACNETRRPNRQAALSITIGRPVGRRPARLSTMLRAGSLFPRPAAADCPPDGRAAPPHWRLNGEQQP